MKNFILNLAVCSACAFAQPTVWEIDPGHTSAQFSVRHLMISNVRGEFTKVTGKAIFDPKNLAASSLEASIDVSSITTREERRDNHLKSAAFFDAAKYPAILFKSRQFTKTANGLTITGDLTIHGVTRTVTLAVDGPSHP